MAIARLLELGKDEVGCVSTGNVGTAVAALAAKAGATAYIFYPGNMEKGKAKACRALGAQVCQLDGNYDQANRACRELSLASGIQFANITLRPFYAEGAKTMAFEVVEELGWVAPDHMVIPAAGGTLSSRVHKGLKELEAVGLAETAGTRIDIAQAGGCSPIATAIREGGELEPQTPETAAHSLAIGAPGDGNLVLEAVRTRGGSAAAPSDPEIFEAIDLLGATEGILTEPAGGTTIAATARLAAEGKLDPDETVVAVISGNGLKTLSEHPDKPWPEMVACDVDTMGAMLDEFRRTAAAARALSRGPRERAACGRGGRAPNRPRPRARLPRGRSRRGRGRRPLPARVAAALVRVEGAAAGAGRPPPRAGARPARLRLVGRARAAAMRRRTWRATRWRCSTRSASSG